MSRKETFKYYIKAKLDKATNDYDLDIKVKGDYFESLVFAVEAVTRSCIGDLGLDRKTFLKNMGAAYDIIKEGDNNE